MGGEYAHLCPHIEDFEQKNYFQRQCCQKWCPFQLTFQLRPLRGLLGSRHLFEGVHFALIAIFGVLGMLSVGQGGEHGRRLCERDHYRLIFNTRECPAQSDLEKLDAAERVLGELVAAREEAGKSWYKIDQTDIPVVGEGHARRVMPLSTHSPMVAGLKPTRRVSLYAKKENVAEVNRKLNSLASESTQ